MALVNPKGIMSQNIMKAFGGGKKDISKLQKKTITNKKGHTQTVYVKGSKDDTEHKKLMGNFKERMNTKYSGMKGYLGKTRAEVEGKPEKKGGKQGVGKAVKYKKGERVSVEVNGKLRNAIIRKEATASNAKGHYFVDIEGDKEKKWSDWLFAPNEITKKRKIQDGEGVGKSKKKVTRKEKERKPRTKMLIENIRTFHS